MALVIRLWLFFAFVLLAFIELRWGDTVVVRRDIGIGWGDTMANGRHNGRGRGDTMGNRYWGDTMARNTRTCLCIINEFP